MELCKLWHLEGEPERPGTVECPQCHKWFCDECAATFMLDMGPIFGHEWVRITPICAQCHYDIFIKGRGAE